MEWLDNLKAFRKNRGITYSELSEKTNIPKTTLEKLFSGRTADPGIVRMKKIVEAMGYTLSQLVGDNTSLDIKEEKLIEKYRRLDAPGRNIVNFVIDHEFSRIREIEKNNRIMNENNNCEPEVKAKNINKSENIRFEKMFPSVYFDFPVSAGTGEYMDMDNTKMIETVQRPPEGTSFVIRISGDSMEPRFFDGDHVFVEKTDIIDYGEIGVFICAGNVYMKEYTKKGLKSLNPQYDIIPPSPDMRCLGRVLSSVEGKFCISG